MPVKQAAMYSRSCWESGMKGKLLIVGISECGNGAGGCAIEISKHKRGTARTLIAISNLDGEHPNWTTRNVI